MNKVVIAVADQVIAQELRSRLDQSDAEIEVAFVADSTQEMVSAVLAHAPALLFVHDQLGPGPVLQLVRDLTLRNPALAVQVVTTEHTAETFDAAINSGARSVLAHPFGLEDLDHRLASLIEWNHTVRTALADTGSDRSKSATRGGRVIAVAGAKGGVGTTVIASHLAWDAARSNPQMRVCLVDLDIESGDVPSYLDVSHRVSIADLAKISEDLTSRAVADTVVVHSSGLHLLLAPNEIRDTEFVTSEAVRRIIGQLRSLYHLVVIDVGSAITTTQAAAVESSDRTVQLVTADVPALRAARRQVVAWESLGVARADAIHVVVNRFIRRSEIQQDTVDMLVLGQRSQILVPDLGVGLERAGNSRTPAEVRNAAWWKSLRAIGGELDVAAAYRAAVAAVPEAIEGATVSGTTPGGQKPPAPAGRPGAEAPGAAGSAPASASAAPASPRRRGRRFARAEAGQATLETAALFPVALVLLVMCLQMIMLGVSAAYSGVAAGAAARAVSIGASPQAAVDDALPAGMRSKVAVSSGGDTVSVTVKAPLMIGPGVSRDVTVGLGHQVVEEPR
jgi:pilus assembly protein CpaE